MIHLCPRHHRLILGLMMTTQLLSLALVQPVGAAADRALNQTRVTGSCALPLVHDRYVGFHIGVPTGWNMTVRGGAVIVSKDTAGTEMGLIYPALLTRGLTPAHFFAAVNSELQRSTAAAGNSISVRLTSRPGQLPRASVSGRVGKSAELGHAEVLLAPDRTALATEQAVFFIYWAPARRFASDAAVLSGIGSCYGPEAGTLYQFYQDGNFVSPLPLGWQVASEQQDFLEVWGDAHRAMAAYLLTTLPASARVTTARSLRQYAFARWHIQVYHVLFSQDTVGSRTADDVLPSQEMMEFIGRLSGKAIHGMVIVNSVQESRATSGELRLAMAMAGQWNATTIALIHVADSIRRNPQYDQTGGAQGNQALPGSSQIEPRFHDVITDLQVVEDSATGTYYEAPDNCYTIHGPSGPGYYLDRAGTLVRLRQVK